MGRRREKNPKRHQLCLRLTDRQLELLKRYKVVRGVETEVDAVRFMIDGLEKWLAKRESPQPGEHQSAPPSVPERYISAGEPGEPEPADSMGDFGGMPNPGLPES